MSKKIDLLKFCDDMGIPVPSKATIAQLEALIEANENKFSSLIVKVERAKSRRGRKTHVKQGMVALITNWKDMVQVGDTIILPDTPENIVTLEGSELHSALTLLRHHFRKYARPAGLNASVDYTIEFHPEHGATITRLS